jgi:hypothetical protein
VLQIKRERARRQLVPAPVPDANEGEEMPVPVLDVVVEEEERTVVHLTEEQKQVRWLERARVRPCCLPAPFVLHRRCLRCTPCAQRCGVVGYGVRDVLVCFAAPPLPPAVFSPSLLPC